MGKRAQGAWGREFHTCPVIPPQDTSVLLSQPRIKPVWLSPLQNTAVPLSPPGHTCLVVPPGHTCPVIPPPRTHLALLGHNAGAQFLDADVEIGDLPPAIQEVPPEGAALGAAVGELWRQAGVPWDHLGYLGKDLGLVPVLSGCGCARLTWLLELSHSCSLESWKDISISTGRCPGFLQCRKPEVPKLQIYCPELIWDSTLSLPPFPGPAHPSHPADPAIPMPVPLVPSLPLPAQSTDLVPSSG